MLDSKVQEYKEKAKHYLIEPTDSSFESLALELFHIQAEHCTIYREYIQLIGIDSRKVNAIEDIPFLPISFFKTQIVKTGDWFEYIVFESSSTTGQGTSKHFIRSLEWYNYLSQVQFEVNYGPLSDYTIFALLPSYIERPDSSLIRMVKHWIHTCGRGGFFLNEHHLLASKLKLASENEEKVLLIGVSFALMDFVEDLQLQLPDLIVMETGGMKGRRKEITRSALHEILCQSFGVTEIHSEYGMTELMSQAYAPAKGIFHPSPMMRLFPRSIYDPLSKGQYGKQAALNIIDLGNYHSSAFLATDDLGVVFPDGRFEVIGRVDMSDIRGCNLMIDF
jgi:hypothetical protein